MHVPDEMVSRALDKTLWSYPQIGFLPHCYSTDRLADRTPVLIARTIENRGPDDLLINLSGRGDKDVETAAKFFGIDL